MNLGPIGQRFFTNGSASGSDREHLVGVGRNQFQAVGALSSCRSLPVVRAIGSDVRGQGESNPA